MSLCKSALVDGTELTIYDYMKCKQLPYCKHGHKLIPVQGVKNKWHFRHVTPCKNKLFIKMASAGSGKTWHIINMIQRKEFLHYTKFIYVSKQHSARVIIKDEFMSQYNSGLLNISNFSFKDLGKKYIIEYMNSVNINCCIIISTIDSFMYAVGDKTVQSYDLFEGIVQSIIDNSKIDENIKFATMETSLSETLYILDESQDLKEMYAKALIKIMKDTNMSSYIVGDRLQSISNEQNALTYLLDAPVLKYIEPTVNITRRFSHPQLFDFVNYMIPFKKYGLMPIVPYEKANQTQNQLNALTVMFQKENMNMNEQIEQIMAYYAEEVETNNYSPEDFLIVSPFISNNPIINALNSSINEFWIDKLGANDYYNYSVIHKSEIGTSINLDDSIKSTRIVSIHSSKGDGRNCVFVIGLYEKSLKTFSGLRDSLIYDSLLHVAITRMKKKLYILCIETDEIGGRIKNFLLKNDLPCSASSLNISSIIKIKNILPMNGCGERISSLLNNNNNYDFTPDTITNNYNIRQGIMLERLTNELKEQQFDRTSHIKVINNIALNTPIITCTSWKEYNVRLKMINGTEENQYTDKTVCIPLLKINGKDYNDYYDIIIKNMEIIHLTSHSNLDPLQMIIFYYMKQVTSLGKYTNISILELYKIVHQFNKSDFDTFNDYLLVHQEKMVQVDLIVKNIIDKYPKTSWNTNCHVECNGSFTLKTNVDLIGYNKDETILLYVVPWLNKLNMNEIKIKSFVDSYIVSKSGNIKYDKKKIIVGILSLNGTYYDEINNNFIGLKQILKETLFEHFSLKNKEVYHYYKENEINKNVNVNVEYIDQCINDTNEINCDFLINLNESLTNSLDTYFQ